MTRTSLALAALVALIGCNGNGDDTTDTNTCDNAIISTLPADGATNAYYRGTIEVKFDAAEDDATFTVTPTGGSALTGDYTWVSDTLVFTPSSPLAPSTEHTLAITYSCGSPSTTFTTSEVGTPVNLTTSPLDGRSYLLDLASGRFVQPAGIGSIIGDFLDQIVIVSVDNVDTDAEEITMLGALGLLGSGGATTVDGEVSGVVQECQPTIDFPSGTDFSANPFFGAGPADTTISVAEFTVTIQDLLIAGSFGPDGSYISGATVAGKIDTRPLVPFISLTPAPCDEETYEDSGETVDNPNYPCEPDAICEIAGSLFIECEPCADGSTATVCGDGAGEDACCLTLLVDSIVAVELEKDDAAWPLTATTDPGTGADGTGAAGDPIDPCDVDGITCPTSACVAR